MNDVGEPYAGERNVRFDRGAAGDVTDAVGLRGTMNLRAASEALRLTH